jgi:hypothetical protein
MIQKDIKVSRFLCKASMGRLVINHLDQFSSLRMPRFSRSVFRGKKCRLSKKEPLPRGLEVRMWFRFGCESYI